MISLYDLIEASNGQLFGEPAAQLFDDFCLDAAKAQDSQLFVALKSEHGDTHQYIPEAIENGVAGVICHNPPSCDTEGVSVILVKNTVSALLAWAHYVLGKFGTKVIGVTGSAGKSIAVDAISRVLATQHKVHVGLREEAGRLCAPLALSKLNANHRFAVLKLSTDQAGEMAAMVQSVQPEVGVVTHIGELFAAQFETFEDVAHEMGILIDYLSPSGLAVLNYDEDHVRSMMSHTRATARTVGMTSFGADMMTYNVDISATGTNFDLRYGSERFIGQHLPLYGQYHLYSVMAALTIGLHFDISLQDSLQALQEMTPLPGRMNSLLGKNGCLLIDDTYNANPQSTLAALDWLGTMKDDKRRVFFVLGDMSNLGRQAQLGHRRVGERSAEVADVIITQGAHASMAGRAAIDHGKDSRQVHVTYATQDTVALIANQYELDENDVLLITGGPTSRMELVVAEALGNEEDKAQLVRQDVVWEGAKVSQPAQLSWIEIDTNALANNVRLLKQMIGDDVALMSIVKGNAYGHGAVVTAQTALLNGADYLGVSSLQEGFELRDAGIVAPILILNYAPTYMVRQAMQQDLTLTLYDLNMARSYDRIAREIGQKLKVHIKIDSGMGRLGVTPKDAIPLFRHLITMQNLDVEGVYTHFSTADEEDQDYTQKQIKNFMGVVRPIQATTGIRFKYLHAANSAATISMPDTHFNMVRVGLAMYGMHPSEIVQLPEGFEPIMNWKTVIAQVKTLPKDHPVGYGNTFVTRREERIAVLPVGYSDGFRRSEKKSSGEVLLHGQRAPIIGRVSMEKTVIRVTHIPEVAVGDEVVLLGKQSNKVITAEEIARRLETINYEVTTLALPRGVRR